MQDKFSFNPMYNLRLDGPASVVVFLVALPLCFGIALASGAPLVSGLIAGVVGGVVAGALSKSAVSVSGPAAGLSTIVLASINELGSFPLFLSCVVIAGIIQIALGYLKAGTIGHFFPLAVIKGMLAAIGLILILKQLPHAVGYDSDFEGDENFFQPDGQNTFTEILNAFQQISTGAIVIAFVSFLILWIWAKIKPKYPKLLNFLSAPLVIVAVGIFMDFMFQNFIPELEIKAEHLVRLPDFHNVAIGSGIFTFPDFTNFWSMGVFRIAVTIAIVASLETLLCVEAIDKLDPYRRITPLNHELKAQGVANIFSGLLGGLPVTAVIVRGSANVMAGARTKASAVMHGLLLIIAVLAVPDLIQMIPLASLAVILISVGYKLTAPEMYKGIFRKGVNQFLPFVVTVLAILLSDILIGIFVGLLVSLFFVLKTNFRTAIILVNQGNQYLLRFTKDVSFLHKSALRTALEKVPENASLIIDGARNHFVDEDIQETIEDYVKGAPTKNISVEIKKSMATNGHSFKTVE